MKTAKICSTGIVFSFLVLFVSLLLAAGEQTPPASGRVYVSFLWAGKSDTDCMLRDTLLTDTTAEWASGSMVGVEAVSNTIRMVF